LIRLFYTDTDSIYTDSVALSLRVWVTSSLNLSLLGLITSGLDLENLLFTHSHPDLILSPNDIGCST
jgi:hypothetical protein